MVKVDIKLKDDYIRFRNAAAYTMNMHSHDDLQITIPLDHSSFEISWGVDGDAYEQKILNAGGICIIPPMLQHQITWINKAHFINIHVSPATVRALLGDLYDVDEMNLYEQIGIRDEFLQNIGRGLAKAFTRHDKRALHYYRSALNLALHHAYENYASMPMPSVVNVPGRALPCPKVQDAVNYIHQNLHRGISIEELATVAKSSPFHFVRKFKEMIGMSPVKFHLQQRIEVAKEKLSKTDHSIARIAKDLGFSSQPYFSTLFSKNTGETPARYRLRFANSKHL